MNIKPAATLDLAVREAVVAFYQSHPQQQAVTIPIGEALGSLIFFAVEIAMSIPPGPYRDSTLDHIRDLVAASEVSIATGRSVGAVMAEKRGEKVN